MSPAPTRDEVQNILVALLIAKEEALKTGVPLIQLNKEYKEQEGTDIPFRQLGYSRLQDFLRSLTGRLSIKYRNDVYWAYPVVTDEIKHVSSLVAGQKSKRKTRKNREKRKPYNPRVIQPWARQDTSILAEIITIAKNTPEGLHMSWVLDYVQHRLNCCVDYNDLTLELRKISPEVIIECDVLYYVPTYHQQQPDARAFGTNGPAAQHNIYGQNVEPTAAPPTVLGQTIDLNGMNCNDPRYSNGFESTEVRNVQTNGEARQALSPIIENGQQWFVGNSVIAMSQGDLNKSMGLTMRKFRHELELFARNGVKPEPGLIEYFEEIVKFFRQ